MNVADAQRELGAEDLVDAEQFLAGIVRAAKRIDEVEVEGIGCGQFREDVLDVCLGDGVDGSNGVPRGSAGAFRSTRQADRMEESALQHGLCGNDGGDGAIGDDAADFLREEEESLVLGGVVVVWNVEGTAEGVAKIVIAERRTLDGFAVVEKVVGGQPVVTEELVGVTVESAGAGLGGDDDLASSGAAVFGFVLAAEHHEFGNGVDAGVGEQGEIGAAVHVIGAVDSPVVGAATLPADGKAD